ncbi:MAG: hypothetical protein ABSB90_06270 [Thermoplasmata archaeon]|jgi:hypothetical protein
MEIEWLLEDSDSLAHASKLRVDGKSALAPLKAEVVSPLHATTRGERTLISRKGKPGPSKPTLAIAGEPLARPTLETVGYSKASTDELIRRLGSRRMDDCINLVYTRIPGRFTTSEGVPLPMPPLDDIRASALVDVQIEAGASLVIPPLPTGLSNEALFRRCLERTRVAVQTSSGKQDIIGYIPTTDNLELVRDMVTTYAKIGVRFFGVDFSGASNQPALMRSVVRSIRERLNLKRRSRAQGETYYLHVFNAATSKKSSKDVTPLSDIITHPYGVDSTSGQMWGAGTLDPEKLRYYRVADYGAYRRGALKGEPLSCECATCDGSSVSDIYKGAPHSIQERLRVHRVSAYSEECARITESLSASKKDDGYVPYLSRKKTAASDITRILTDVREIRAAL